MLFPIYTWYSIWFHASNTLYMHMLHFSTGRTIVPDVTDLIDRTWRVSDGSSMFLSCRPVEPSNGFEYCVMTQNDIKRNALIPFICERELNYIKCYSTNVRGVKMFIHLGRFIYHNSYCIYIQFWKIKPFDDYFFHNIWSNVR